MQESLDDYQKVCETNEIPDDTGHVVSIDDHEIAIFEVDDEFLAITNVCPHQGGPLAEGKVEEKTVFCPWHGYEFDLESGDHIQAFSDDLSCVTYDVVVQDDAVHVKV
ncbi:nitrite reductase small subunit NirD [Natrinema soli]|uniref:Nitrite reductase small subunit NirD n=1 Tax=Natrinema soli TaxID=1930624 RepID=A0ABD5SH85_9EURY|nr:nitrite reductase small subunit NirD [Natrinema soli]